MIKKVIKAGKLKVNSWRRDWLRKEHKLNYLFWECTLNCNFFCKHCGSSAGRKCHENELTAKEIKKVFREVAEAWDAKKIMLAITGGEPLLRADLFEIMSYAHGLGFEWGMVTNGFLVDEKVVNKMKDSGMSSVVVSIDGIGKTHDDLRQMAGAYEKAIKAVKLIKKDDFVKILQVTTTVNKINFPEIEKMYDIMLDLGLDSWRVMNVDPIGRAELNKELMLDSKELKWLLDFIKEKRSKKGMQVTFGCEGFLGLEYEGDIRDWFFYCGTGINIASILHNGDIYVCPNVPRRKELIQGNVREDSFVKVWEEKFTIFRDEKRTCCEECEGCKWWEECLGGSFHLWDFEKNRPKVCHVKMLGEGKN